MTQIIFERSGGFFEPPINLALDLDSLAPRDVQHWMYLIEDADFFRFPEDLVMETDSAGNKFIYSIVVETGGMRHRVHVSEMYLSEPLQMLVDELSELAPVS